MVNLFEALFILGLDDEAGDILDVVRGSLESTMAGAVLAELVLHYRVGLADQRLIVTDPTRTDHPVLDTALFGILEAARPRKVKYWINTLTYKRFLNETGHHLVEQGVLVRQKKRLHLAPPSGEGLNGGVSAKYSLKNRLREIVLMNQPPDLPEKVLLAFLFYGQLLKLVFTHDERMAAHRRVKKLVEKNEEGSRLGETLDAIVAAACETD